MRFLLVYASGLACGVIAGIIAFRHLPAWPWEFPALATTWLTATAARFWPATRKRPGRSRA